MNGEIVRSDAFVRMKGRKQRLGGSGADGVNELFPLPVSLSDFSPTNSHLGCIYRETTTKNVEEKLA